MFQAMISVETNQLTPAEQSKVENFASSGERYRVKAVDTSTGHHVIAYTFVKHPETPLHQTLKVKSNFPL